MQSIRVTHIGSSSSIGGGETHLLLLARYLHGRDFHFDFLLPEEGPFCESLRSVGLEFRVVPMTTKFNLGSHRRIRQLLEKSRPDVVHCHGARANWYGRSSASQAGVRAIFTTVHNSLRDYPYSEWRRKFYVLIEKRTAHLVTQWIAVSNSIKADLVEYYGLPADKVEVVPNGVDLSNLQIRRESAEVRREFGIPAKAFLILAAARMTEQKGHRFLLEAIERLHPRFPNLFCLLAGDGPQRQSLEDRAERLGISKRVMFVGFRSDVADLIGAADLYVLPSLSEGMPLGLLEAMVLGCPTVASAVNGVPEIICHEGQGVLIPPGDVSSLTAALKKLISDPALRSQLAENGRLRVKERFTAQGMARRVGDLYHARLAETDLPVSTRGI